MIGNFKKDEILIVGLARNCEKTLEKDISILESAFKGVGRLSFLVIESDSTDNTIHFLERKRIENKSFRYISLGTLRNQYPKRTERLAYCRNHYIKILKEDSLYQKVDYIVIADLDGVNSSLSQSAVESCWMRDDWEVCTANQSGPYYDIWALRHEIWSPNDCLIQAKFLIQNGLSRYQSFISSMYNRMLRISSNHEWIEVDSAFGGLAIYKREVLESVNYVGLNENGEEVCEHVSIHEQIRSKKGRIFINPAFINTSIVGHAWYATYLGKKLYWIRCKLVDILFFLGFDKFFNSNQ